MPSDPMKPVPGVAVVRFAPVQYAMHPAPAGRFHLLTKLVGGIEVIMPEQHHGLHKRLAGERAIQHPAQRGQRLHPRRGPGPNSGGSGVVRRVS